MGCKGRPKGTKNRKWTVDQKLAIVKEYLSGTISNNSICKEKQINQGMLHAWVTKYLANGENGLISQKGKHNNQCFSALLTCKDLSEVKRLQLQVAKLEVEIERLKKGYLVKGVGVKKEFVFAKDLNTK